jgi:hypothetical protein
MNLLGRVCGDCRGRYWHWFNHAFGKKHLRAIEKIIVGKSNPDLLLDFYEKFGDFLR